MVVCISDATIEYTGTLGMVERYHVPLRAAYQRIRDDLGKDHSNSDCRRMALFSVSSTMGLEGLCPLRLLSGAIPRPARGTPYPTQIKRASAIYVAISAPEN